MALLQALQGAVRPGRAGTGGRRAADAALGLPVQPRDRLGARRRNPAVAARPLGAGARLSGGPRLDGDRGRHLFAHGHRRGERLGLVAGVLRPAVPREVAEERAGWARPGPAASRCSRCNTPFPGRYRITLSKGDDTFRIAVAVTPARAVAVIGTRVSFTTRVEGDDLSWRWQTKFENEPDDAWADVAGATGPQLDVVTGGFSMFCAQYRAIISSPRRPHRPAPPPPSPTSARRRCSPRTCRPRSPPPRATPSR